MRSFKAGFFSGFLFAIIFPAALSADPGFVDAKEMPYVLVRSGRWDDVISHYNRRSPSDSMGYLAYARAWAERDPKGKKLPWSDATARAIYYYLKAASIACEKTRSDVDVLACLDKPGKESKKDTIQRLALWKAAAEAKRYGARHLERRLLEIPALMPDDPLSRRIFIDRASVLLDFNFQDAALAFIRDHDYVTGGQVALWKAKVNHKAQKRDAAFAFYVQALRETEEEWVRNSILLDLRSRYPEVFSGVNLSKNTPVNRALVSASGLLRKDEVTALALGMTPAVLTQSASPSTALSDGLFLIRSHNAGALDGYAASVYTYVSLQPDILYYWAASLVARREYGPALRLYAKFPHVKKQHPGFWTMLLDILEAQSAGPAYFGEVVSYLSEFHADNTVYDRLVEYLIGRRVGKIQWASDASWRDAEARLQGQTAGGRFVYWLSRYRADKGKPGDAKQITDNFYERAPGSYYARAFWDETQAGDFRGDWNKVRDRSSYLRWVSHHGGRDESVSFLSKKDTYRYLNPRAVELWKNIRDASPDIPSPIIDLFNLGEYSLADEYYRANFAGALSKRENLHRMAYIGRKTQNLYLSVYYTRQLCRDYAVPEDPFSMPPGLLRELYPRPYRESVRRYSNANGIEEEMVYALMRQESMFKELAVSRSGAMGLMQIMPQTAGFLAKAMRLPSANAMVPEVSIQMGAKFFSDLLRSYNNDFRWAAIAYNGGPGNLQMWKRQYYSGDFNLFLENLPVQEPRHYCRVTYQNYMHYRVTYLLYP
ncbi:MAG: lytic transglycosylase domain-containing protein [Spirochaetia bacterium]|nr:lytic transglycosylase domain-containing protein [Spirochaetia bacterium]